MKWLFVSLDSHWNQLKELRHRYHGNRHHNVSVLHPNLLAVVAKPYQNVREQPSRVQVELVSLMLIDKYCLWEKIPREILETMLMHGLSHAVDHGLVRPKEKGRSGKRPRRITISSEILGESLPSRSRIMASASIFPRCGALPRKKT